ncbi:MAG: transglutaminase, partial [Bacteroidetes bacterium]
GEFIYVKPLLNEATEKNPFTQESREYPVDFAYPILERYTLILSPPEGYVIEELPKPASFSMPGGAAKFTLNAAVAAGNVQLISTVELKQVSFYPEEYSALKQFFDLIVAKQSEQIVLKKVN